MSSFKEHELKKIKDACLKMDATSTLTDLALESHLSVSAFERLFKKVMQITPYQYYVQKRINLFKEELLQNSSITHALLNAGFNTPSRFYEKTNESLGMSPRSFKNKGFSETLYFALGECVLGHVIVVRSEKGVCAIHFGDDPVQLLNTIQQIFSNANLVGQDEVFNRTVSQIVALIQNASTSHQLPLDIRGTEFQQKIWNALRSIPYGETRTYQEIAQKVHLPKAVRAVANACASNNIALAIPCHRVVRTDGSLSGYRWGIERKQQLLNLESEKQ